MAHESIFDTGYTWHGTVEQGHVHRIRFSTPGRTTDYLPFRLVHRGGIDPLWFDYTFDDGDRPHNPGSPSSDITPSRPDSFVVMPLQQFMFTPDHPINEVTLTAVGTVHYSVMLLW